MQQGGHATLVPLTCVSSPTSPPHLPVPPHSSSSSLQAHSPADARLRRQHQHRAFPLVDACGLLKEAASSSCTLWPLPGLTAGSREQSNVTARLTLSREWSYSGTVAFSGSQLMDPYIGDDVGLSLQGSSWARCSFCSQSLCSLRNDFTRANASYMFS